MLFVAVPASAQDRLGGGRPSTVLPTDTAPMALPGERQALGESLKLRLWQKLPARFYFSGTVESSFRIETNVFQFPSRSALLRKFAPDGLENLSPEGAQSVQGLLDRAYAEDVVYRITPNVTAGWALTQNTRVFANYFLLRDKLFKYNVLNTTINQIGVGIEHQRQIPKTRGTYELQFTMRELFQQDATPVFDYIPSLTLSYPLTKSYDWVAYFNAILQLRSTKFMELPNRNITPFYTWGLAHTRGKWAFSANATMLNSFQKGFSASQIDFNSGSWICDFEIARQVIDKLPGFQAFVRCEPVFNFAGRNTPGLSGNDIRIFFGLRMSAYKPPLLATMQMLQQQYRPQEQKQPRLKKKPVGPDPSAPQEGEGNDGDGKSKPASTGPIGQQNSSDDLSVISLDADCEKIDEANSYFKTPDTCSRFGTPDTGYFTTPASCMEETPAISRAGNADHANSFGQSDHDPVCEEDETTLTPAPIHGFLENEKPATKQPGAHQVSMKSFDSLAID